MAALPGLAGRSILFFSLPKILALLAVIVAVWYGFRLLEA